MLRLLALQLLPVHFQPLAGRGDVEQAPLDLLVHLQLALVGVVQRFAGIFHLVEGFGSVGLEEPGKPLPETHAFKLLTTRGSCGRAPELPGRAWPPSWPPPRWGAAGPGDGRRQPSSGKRTITT